MAKSVVMHRINVYQIRTKIGEKSMIDYAYYNGIITPYDACSIPLSDRSIFFGDSVYDVILGRNKTPYQPEEHLERLYANAASIGLILPSDDEVREAIETLIRESGATDFMLYIQLSGYGYRRTHARRDNRSNLLITLTETHIPEKLCYVKAITESDSRHAYCNVKTTDLLPAVLSATGAEARGADVSIFVKDGYVTECSAANISLLKDRLLITHPLDSSILPGICERNLIDICHGLGIGHEVRPFGEDELFLADAVLVTSTTKLIRQCNEINGMELVMNYAELTNTIFSLMWKDLADKTR